MKITGYNIVRAINQLPKNRAYNYVNPQTKTLLRIENVSEPSGPIFFKRWDPTKGKSYLGAKRDSISSEMIWRVANTIRENEPLNLDRILAGSYNTRSTLEALMAHTPEFYYCYPGRVLDVDGRTKKEHGHKHLIWRPDMPHIQGVMVELNVEGMEMSEIPTHNVVYEALSVPDSMMIGGMDIDVVRRHTQIQIALYLIGLRLGYRTWIAQNDKGIMYNHKPLIEHDGVVSELSEETMIYPYPGAIDNARFIDCIWFKNHTLLPAVMEVEHSTGITSGLCRMMNLKKVLPNTDTRYVIVASDDDRDKVVREINREQFRELNARYFPYSSVEELYYLCVHRDFSKITQGLLDCYMENVSLAN